MAERYERFRIETGPKGPQVVLDQRRNAVGNLIIGASVALAGWFAHPQIAPVLIGIGCFWAGLALLSFFVRRELILGDHLEYITGRKSRILPREQVKVFRVYRKLSKHGSGRRPLPWTVEILAEGEEKPFIEFRLAGEDAARRLAERMGEVTGLAPEGER